MEKVKKVRISSKGQIVIPRWIREKLDLRKGDELLVELSGDRIILKPTVKLSELRGIDGVKGLSRELDNLRRKWDEEIDVRY